MSHRVLLLAFSLHFSPSSAFLMSLSRQSSHLCCGLPRFLPPPWVLVSYIFYNLILTRCQVRYTQLSTILATVQSLVLTSLRSSFLLLSTLFARANLFIQLICHTCSLRCFCSDRATVSKPRIQDLPFLLSGNLSNHH